MLITPQTIQMRWHQRNRGFYVERGYSFTMFGDIFEVNIADLPVSCNKYVEVLCDYCFINVKREPYQAFTRNQKGIVKKDCCKECKPLKVRESNLLVYGKESTNQIPGTLQKMKATNLIRHGGENVMASKSVRKKVEQTNLSRYGTKTPAQNQSVKDKMKATNIIKYGEVSPTLNKDVRQKQITSMLEKYGVEYGMQSMEILSKSKETLFQNGTVPTSRQQRYIWDLIGGELNYPFKNYSLDIAFPKKEIYVECDFGGHWLQVKLGNKTLEEFTNEERKRYYALFRKGWRIVRIISKKDKLPKKEKLIEMMSFAYLFIEKGHSWIHFDLDKSLVINSLGEDTYNFGDLYYWYQLTDNQ